MILDSMRKQIKKLGRNIHKKRSVVEVKMNNLEKKTMALIEDVRKSVYEQLPWVQKRRGEEKIENERREKEEKFLELSRVIHDAITDGDIKTMHRAYSDLKATDVSSHVTRAYFLKIRHFEEKLVKQAIENKDNKRARRLCKSLIDSDLAEYYEGEIHKLEKNQEEERKLRKRDSRASKRASLAPVSNEERADEALAELEAIFGEAEVDLDEAKRKINELLIPLNKLEGDSADELFETADQYLDLIREMEEKKRDVLIQEYLEDLEARFAEGIKFGPSIRKARGVVKQLARLSPELANEWREKINEIEIGIVEDQVRKKNEKKPMPSKSKRNKILSKTGIESAEKMPEGSAVIFLNHNMEASTKQIEGIKIDDLLLNIRTKVEVAQMQRNNIFIALKKDSLGIIEREISKLLAKLEVDYREEHDKDVVMFKVFHEKTPNKIHHFTN
jgi:hypothetical protein